MPAHMLMAAASLKAPISLTSRQLFGGLFLRKGCDEIVRRVGAIMREQHRINSGLGLARCAGMRAFSYIAALSLVGAILVASTSFTDRRSVKTWAPNTVVLKPKPLETAALVSPKHDAAAGTLNAEGASLAASEQLSSAKAPTATRSSTTVTDPESTGTLPKEVETQNVAPKASPALPHALRDRRYATRPARQASARARVIAQTRAAPALSSREPIQFRLAEGRN